MIGRDVCPRPAAPFLPGKRNTLMVLWLLFAVMTAAAVFAVLWPLGHAAAVQAGSDIASTGISSTKLSVTAALGGSERPKPKPRERKFPGVLLPQPMPLNSPIRFQSGQCSGVAERQRLALSSCCRS